jgi:hypothetical protein
MRIILRTRTQLLVQRLSVGLPEILVIPQGEHERQEEEEGEWF